MHLKNQRKRERHVSFFFFICDARVLAGGRAPGLTTSLERSRTCLDKAVQQTPHKSHGFPYPNEKNTTRGIEPIWHTSMLATPKKKRFTWRNSSRSMVPLPAQRTTSRSSGAGCGGGGGGGC